MPLYGDCLSNIDKGHYVINWIHESLYILFFLQASYFLLFIVISKGERQIVGDTVDVLSYWSSEYYCDQYFSAHRLKGFHTNLRTDASLISGLSKRVFLIHEGSLVSFDCVTQDFTPLNQLYLETRERNSIKDQPNCKSDKSNTVLR